MIYFIYLREEYNIWGQKLHEKKNACLNITSFVLKEVTVLRNSSALNQCKTTMCHFYTVEIKPVGYNVLNRRLTSEK